MPSYLFRIITVCYLTIPSYSIEYFFITKICKIDKTKPTSMKIRFQTYYIYLKTHIIVLTEHQNLFFAKAVGIVEIYHNKVILIDVGGISYYVIDLGNFQFMLCNTIFLL